MKIKIDCLADQHLYFGSQLEGGDILVIAGDISYVGNPIDFVEFNTWLGKYKDKYKVVIFTPGNHDILTQTDPLLASALMPNVTHYLINQSAKILGLNFFVSPMTPTFMNWAWMADRGEPIKSYWNRIPKNIDVLVTHGPPFEILDECPDINDPSKIVHVGCEELLKAVNRIKPRYHIFGHIHEGHGKLEKDGTTFINCSVVDGNYNPAHQPTLIHLEK